MTLNCNPCSISHPRSVSLPRQHKSFWLSRWQENVFTLKLPHFGTILEQMNRAVYLFLLIKSQCDISKFVPREKMTRWTQTNKELPFLCQFVFTCECYIIVVVSYGWFKFFIYKMLQGGIISPIFSIKEIFLHKRNQCWENLSIQDMKPSKDSKPLNFVSVVRIWL